MNPIAFEYVEKAEGDFATAERELGVTVNPNYDAVCFHAQQCAEKYLKAQLQESGIRFGKTHDLTLLLWRCRSRPLGLRFSLIYRRSRLSRSRTVIPETRRTCLTRWTR